MKYAIAMIAAATAATVAPAPAQAEIVESAHGGMASSHSLVVAADREAVWRELVHPEGWWSHSWSDNPANLHLDPQAGGCFCETVPAANGWPAGSVEHMRVIMVMPGSILRLAGSLGPLQSEGIVGTLTVTLAEEGGGTRITWDYIFGGEARFAVEQLGPLVDGVQAEFLGGLAARLGGALEG
jgi:hypothetical protein